MIDLNKQMEDIANNIDAMQKEHEAEVSAFVNALLVMIAKSLPLLSDPHSREILMKALRDNENIIKDKARLLKSGKKEIIRAIEIELDEKKRKKKYIQSLRKRAENDISLIMQHFSNLDKLHFIEDMGFFWLESETNNVSIASNVNNHASALMEDITRLKLLLDPLETSTKQEETVLLELKEKVSHLASILENLKKRTSILLKIRKVNYLSESQVKILENKEHAIILNRNLKEVSHLTNYIINNRAEIFRVIDGNISMMDTDIKRLEEEISIIKRYGSYSSSFNVFFPPDPENPRMRVLMIVPFYGRAGGVGKASEGLTKALKRNGVAVDVLEHWFHPSPYILMRGKEKIKFDHFQEFMNISSPNMYKIMHLQTWTIADMDSGGAFTNFVRYFRFPSVLTVHSDVAYEIDIESSKYRPDQKGWKNYEKIAQEQIMGGVDWIIELTKFYKEDVLNDPNLHRENHLDYYKKSSVIPNGYDRDALGIFSKLSKKLRDMTSRKKIFTYAGRMSGEKGVLVLVEAFSNMFKSGDKRYDNIILNLVGAGPPEITNKIKSMMAGLEDRIIFENKFKEGEEFQQELKNSDFVIMPSDREVFPLAAIEASIRKIPLIITDIPAMRDFVEGQFAFGIKKTGDWAAIKEVIDHVLSLDQQQIDEKVAKAYNYVGQFSWENVAKDTEALYQDLISNRRPKSESSGEFYQKEYESASSEIKDVIIRALGRSDITNVRPLSKNAFAVALSYDHEVIVKRHDYEEQFIYGFDSSKEKYIFDMIRGYLPSNMKSMVPHVYYNDERYIIMEMIKSVNLAEVGGEIGREAMIDLAESLGYLLAHIHSISFGFSGDIVGLNRFQKKNSWVNTFNEMFERNIRLFSKNNPVEAQIFRDFYNQKKNIIPKDRKNLLIGSPIEEHIITKNIKEFNEELFKQRAIPLLSGIVCGSRAFFGDPAYDIAALDLIFESKYHTQDYSEALKRGYSMHRKIDMNYDEIKPMYQMNFIISAILRDHEQKFDGMMKFLAEKIKVK